MTLPSITPSTGPSRPTSPVLPENAARAETPRSQHGAAVDAFTSRPPSEDAIQATLTQADSLGSQLDDLLAKLSNQERLEQDFGNDQAMLGLTQLQTGGLDQLQPKYPNAPIADTAPLQQALEGREAELKGKGLLRPFHQWKNPSKLDDFSAGTTGRLETLQGLKQSGKSLSEHFDEENAALKARQRQENKAMIQQAGITDSPELREELKKMGLSDGAIEALYQKTGLH